MEEEQEQGQVKAQGEDQVRAQGEDQVRAQDMRGMDQVRVQRGLARDLEQVQDRA